MGDEEVRKAEERLEDGGCSGPVGGYADGECDSFLWDGLVDPLSDISLADKVLDAPLTHLFGRSVG